MRRRRPRVSQLHLRARPMKMVEDQESLKNWRRLHTGVMCGLLEEGDHNQRAEREEKREMRYLQLSRFLRDLLK